MPSPSPTPAAPDIVRTKVVATLGPASRAEEPIRGLVEAGVDVFRLNMAHGSIPEHQESLDRIRRVSEALARPIGVLADLAGPKIRLGELPGGAVECVEGTACPVRAAAPRPAAPDEFTTTYAPLHRRTRRGRLRDARRRHDQPRRRGADADQAPLPRRAGGHGPQPAGGEPAGREALRGGDERGRLAACRVGRGGRGRLREPVVRAERRRGQAAQGAAAHPRLGGPRGRQDREARGDRQPRLDRRRGRRRDGGPRRPGRGDRRGERADGAEADHPRLPAVPEAGDRGHADARQHAARPAAHAGRGHRRGQRDPRRRRRLHALRRDGDRRASAARRWR